MVEGSGHGGTRSPSVPGPGTPSPSIPSPSVPSPGVQAMVEGRGHERSTNTNTTSNSRVCARSSPSSSAAGRNRGGGVHGQRRHDRGVLPEDDLRQRWPAAERHDHGPRYQALPGLLRRQDQELYENVHLQGSPAAVAWKEGPATSHGVAEGADEVSGFRDEGWPCARRDGEGRKRR